VDIIVRGLNTVLEGSLKNTQLTENVLVEVGVQKIQIKMLQDTITKQQVTLDLMYIEVRKLRKKIDSFLNW